MDGAPRRSRGIVRAIVAGVILVGIPALVIATGSAQPPAAPRSIVGRVFGFLGNQQFALLFLVVTGGQLLGRLQWRGIGLGTTGATLILALETSVWALAGEGIRFEIATFASTVFFNFFMFAIGMKVGPQFVSGMRRNGGKFIAIAVLIPGLSFLLTWLLHGWFHFAPGQAPGILSGANTATPGLGAAQTAYLTDPTGKPEDLQVVLGNLSTSFAFSYAITMVLFVVLMKLLPRLFRRDASAEARQYLEVTVGAGAPLPGEAEAFLVGTEPVATRAYAVEGVEFAGHALGELRAALPLVAVERVSRAGRLIPVTDGATLQPGDAVALYATVPRLIEVAPRVGHEVDAPALRETARQTVDLVLDGRMEGRKLIELATGIGHGVYLSAVFRAGEAVPFGPEMVVERGDVLRVSASRERIERLEQEAGTVVRPSFATDVVTLGIGLALGALLGAITVPLGPVKITLGPSVGLLLVGIALSAVRTRRPQLGGPFPEPARKLLEDLGLCVFVAVLGLTSGAGVLQTLLGGGVVKIIVAALIVGLGPPLVAWVVGLYLLKMNSALLLGAVAGGSASAAGLNAGQEASGSTVPAIAYPVAFAIGNVLLTLLSYLAAIFF